MQISRVQAAAASRTMIVTGEAFAMRKEDITRKVLAAQKVKLVPGEKPRIWEIPDKVDSFLPTTCPDVDSVHFGHPALLLTSLGSTPVPDPAITAISVSSEDRDEDRDIVNEILATYQPEGLRKPIFLTRVITGVKSDEVHTVATAAVQEAMRCMERRTYLPSTHPADVRWVPRIGRKRCKSLLAATEGGSYAQATMLGSEMHVIACSTARRNSPELARVEI
ncbi:hypothetical protein [Streptomyces sp. 5-10]|uniref:hypothetical protein n=1 Tax=Streptomyces sp. 5-10 TaxID=878925 RepID=UPI00168B175F|nr:hypothetical protein [Streptomyces sp. 5-10]MBD3004819.1 hypothetical protein [Streptomyces sp. 5-10]